MGGEGGRVLGGISWRREVGGCVDNLGAGVDRCVKGGFSGCFWAMKRGWGRGRVEFLGPRVWTD